MQGWKIDLKRHLSWPVLAWVARCDPATKTVRLDTGGNVEVCGDWFAEGVWDGSFSAGDLDESPNVFGSGARCRGDYVEFVSSTATVDRLLYDEDDGCLWVSNSLPCLLTFMGGAGAHDFGLADWFAFSRTLMKGYLKAEERLPGSKLAARFLYHRNLRCYHADGGGCRIEVVEKPEDRHGFHDYAAYTGYLKEVTGRLLKNGADPTRRVALAPLGTISSGYDSPAVCVMAREHGLDEVLTMSDGRGGSFEDGARIAARLGLRVILASRSAWREEKRLPVSAEALFISGDAAGEDVHFAGFLDSLGGRVLLTGYNGDMLWKLHKEEAPSDLARKDVSGLSLTEFRLVAGFCHVPVPFIGARKLADVAAISASAEMKPWSVGGDYDRPIPRRLVEESGVPRGWVGMDKIANSWLSWTRGLDDSRFVRSSEESFMNHLRNRTGLYLRRFRIPPHWLDRVYGSRAQWFCGMLTLRLIKAGLLRKTRKRWNKACMRYEGGERFAAREFFPWAISHCSGLYKTMKTETIAPE